MWTGLAAAVLIARHAALLAPVMNEQEVMTNDGLQQVAVISRGSC
jgi:hypothetical protein